QACLGFAAYFADPAQPPSADIRAAAAQIGPKQMHTDPGIALLSALSAALAMGLCAFFWIATAWPEGAAAVAFAAVTCTLFASLDDPIPVQGIFPLPIRFFAGVRRFRAASRGARFRADPRRDSNGHSGLCAPRSGNRHCVLYRNGSANELHGRPCDHH